MDWNGGEEVFVDHVEIGPTPVSYTHLVVGVPDLLPDRLGGLPPGDDEEGGPPAAGVQQLDHLGGGKLKEDGIQGLVPCLLYTSRCV